MNEKQKVCSIIVEVFAAMDFVVKPVVRESLDTGCVFAIVVQGRAQLLIGHQGSNLYAIEHLVRAIARQQNIALHFKIDVNEYGQKRKEMFEKIASEAILKVVKTKRPFVLSPMTPYERRLIHMFIADDPRATTDSTGSENQRKVVIKPSPANKST